MSTDSKSTDSKSTDAAQPDIDVAAMLSALTPELIARFRTAVELGKWPNGDRLTPAQRQTCMQAMVVWEHHHLPENQRTGYIDRGTKEDGEECDSHHPSIDAEFESKTEEKPIRFLGQ